MRAQTLERVVRFGLRNYVRNGWLSFATTIILALTLFIVSVFGLQTYVIRQETQALRDKLDMSVYIDDHPSEDQVKAFVQEIKSYPNVRQVQYLDKQAVIDAWNATQANQNIKNLISAQNNPLPRTIKVKASDPAQLGGIANKITHSNMAADISKVSYQDNSQVIQQLSARAKTTVRNGIILSTIFILIVIAFVYNTIRLIIQLRQEEISIMKLVGATDSFIRGPFMVEGALYGILAGILTVPALYIFLKNGLQESNNLVTTTDLLLTNQLLHFFISRLGEIGAILIGAGMIVAICCSWVSVRHHLKAR